VNLLAAVWGAVSMIVALDLRTVQLWAHRLLAIGRP
jgi:hypothetical protein